MAFAGERRKQASPVWCRARAAIAVALVALLSTAPASGQDSRSWTRAYEDGERELTAGDFAAAERSFRLALNHPLSPRSRSGPVLFYGTVRKPYYPEYFLGLALLRQGKEKEALVWLERVGRESLVAAGSKEAGALSAHIDTARKALADDKPPPPPPGESAFVRRLKDVDAAVGAGRLDEALAGLDALQALDAAEFATRNLSARRAQVARQLASRHVAEGDRLRAAGQLQEALDQYRAADRAAPGTGTPGIAEVERLEGERAKLSRESRAQSLVDQGDAFARAGRYPSAMKLYKQALQVDPANQTARSRIAASDRFERARARALAARRERRLEDARRAFDEARAADESRFNAERLGDLAAEESTISDPTSSTTTPAGGVSADQVAPLRNAVVAYLRGDAQQAVSLLEGLESGRERQDAHIRAHVLAWLAVSYAELSLSATESSAREEMRQKAVGSFKQLVAVEPGYSFSEHVVSPRIRQLLTSGGR